MSEKALVFNMIKGSFVDGYGIRTTVFLKGCPLRCIWCCNPEGQSFQPELRILYEKCTGCGRCVSKCSQGALSIKDGLVAIDREKCNGCYDCVDYCFDGAMETFGTWYTAEEIFNIVKKDINFYNSTGGGVTIGGGEATCYPKFMHEIIDLCHGAGISVAVDTCGYTVCDDSLEVLKRADLLLFDVKGLDPVAHERNTGRSNELILNNLKLLSDLRKPIIIRIPIIPGYNCPDEELEQIADLLASLKSVERVDLLPEHEFGKMKYEQIGKDYFLEPQEVSPERLARIIEMFRSRGLNVQNGG